MIQHGVKLHFTVITLGEELYHMLTCIKSGKSVQLTCVENICLMLSHQSVPDSPPELQAGPVSDWSWPCHVLLRSAVAPGSWQLTSQSRIMFYYVSSLQHFHDLTSDWDNDVGHE